MLPSSIECIRPCCVATTRRHTMTKIYATMTFNCMWNCMGIGHNHIVTRPRNMRIACNRNGWGSTTQWYHAMYVRRTLYDGMPGARCCCWCHAPAISSQHHGKLHAIFTIVAACKYRRMRCGPTRGWQRWPVDQRESIRIKKACIIADWWVCVAARVWVTFDQKHPNESRPKRFWYGLIRSEKEISDTRRNPVCVGRCCVWNVIRHLAESNANRNNNCPNDTLACLCVCCVYYIVHMPEWNRCLQQHAHDVCVCVRLLYGKSNITVRMMVAHLATIYGQWSYPPDQHRYGTKLFKHKTFAFSVGHKMVDYSLCAVVAGCIWWWQPAARGQRDSFEEQPEQHTEIT